MPTCKYCAAPIKWRKNKKGKWYAVNLDNKFHSKTCGNVEMPPERNEDAGCSQPCGQEPMGCSTCEGLTGYSRQYY